MGLLILGLVLIALGLMCWGDRAVEESNDYWAFVDYMENRSDLSPEAKLSALRYAEWKRYEQTR